MREPKAPPHDSVDADLAKDFAARVERARLLLEDLAEVRRRAHDREITRSTHPEPESEL
jgi:hypothetical protein